jgi:hypothetical protein
MRPAHWLTLSTDSPPAVVNGRACRSRATFFAEVARALDFPVYFGNNFSALADSLRDVGAVHVIVTGAEELLVDEPPEQLATLLEILARASADGLTLTLCTDAEHEASLRERIDQVSPWR